MQRADLIAEKLSEQNNAAVRLTELRLWLAVIADDRTERPEALTNTIIDFLDLRETFIVSRRDGRVNP